MKYSKKDVSAYQRENHLDYNNKRALENTNGGIWKNKIREVSIK